RGSLGPVEPESAGGGVLRADRDGPPVLPVRGPVRGVRGLAAQTGNDGERLRAQAADQRPETERQRAERLAARLRELGEQLD
ncbi:MAG: hypothetical protein ACXWO3_08965, partial [Isosphaeraceae bacterium]